MLSAAAIVLRTDADSNAALFGFQNGRKCYFFTFAFWTRLTLITTRFPMPMKSLLGGVKITSKVLPPPVLALPHVTVLPCNRWRGQNRWVFCGCLPCGCWSCHPFKHSERERDGEVGRREKGRISTARLTAWCSSVTTGFCDDAKYIMSYYYNYWLKDR